MSSVRISAAIRDEIIANVMAHKFVVESATVTEKEERIEALEKSRNQHGYEMVYSERARKRLEEAPEGWYPTATSVQVMVEDDGVVRVHFGRNRLVPFDHKDNNYNKVVAIVPGEHPYFVAQRAVDEARQDLADFREELNRQRRSTTARVLAVINSVTTTGKLLDVWPEVAPFLPEMVSSSSGGVPAEFIGDLNNHLNIGAK